MIDFAGLSEVLGELNQLTTVDKMTKHQEKRYTYLLAAASAIKSGATLQQVLQEDLNTRARENGIPAVSFEKPEPIRMEKRADEARVWAHFLATGRIEQRDETVGASEPQYYSGGMGSFVPRDFYDRVAVATKLLDPLTNPNVCRFIETENGRPLQVSWIDDTTSQGVLVTENTNLSGSEQDIAFSSEVDLRAFSFRTPLWRMSVEAFQDLDQMITAVDLFEKFVATRVARGVGNYLMNGTGSGQPLGLIPSLVVAGAPSVVAIGSSESTGGAQTGSNSIGYSDCVNLMEAVDSTWVDNPKFAFMCHPQTRSYLRRILDKNGKPLVNFETGGAHNAAMYYMFDKPLHVSYSMPQIGPSQIPLLCGDFDMWVTRFVKSGNYTKVYKEFPGGIEKGEVGLRSFSRWDGALLCSSRSIPFAYLINHS